MSAEAFAKACKRECDAMLAMYADPNGPTHVAGRLNAAGLSDGQRREVIAALNCALTDAFYTMLMALDGAASLGGSQQPYQILDEDGRTISCGDGELEAAAYEAFHGRG